MVGFSYICWWWYYMYGYICWRYYVHGWYKGRSVIKNPSSRRLDFHCSFGFGQFGQFVSRRKTGEHQPRSQALHLSSRWKRLGTRMGKKKAVDYRIGCDTADWPARHSWTSIITIIKYLISKTNIPWKDSVVSSRSVLAFQLNEFRQEKGSFGVGSDGWDQILERVQANIDWREANEADIEEWLRNFFANKPGALKTDVDSGFSGPF